MKRLLTAVVLLAATVLEAANVSGYVANAETGETIIAVNIMVAGTNRGTTTDINGFFVIRDLSPGEATLQFTHIAYEEHQRTLRVDSQNLFLGTVTMTPTVIQAEAVIVKGHAANIIQEDMDIASFEVNPEVLRKVPQFNKDVFQLIKYSPSVTIGDRISPIYYVRGGDPGENLVQLDGMTIYNPQHSIGLQAIFNPYAIKNIELLVGGFDAQYGGRNSSILYITSREGHKEEVQGEFRPSTSGLVGAIEFPVARNATAMVSGRFLSDLLPRVLMGMPNLMADFNAALQAKLGRTRLRLSTFYARDYIDYDFIRLGIYFKKEFLRTYSTGFLTNTANTAVGLQTRSVLTPNLVLESHLYHSGFQVNNNNFIKFRIQDTTYEGNVDVVLNYETRVINEVSDNTIKFGLSWFTTLNQTVQLGVEQNRISFLNDAGMYALASFSTEVTSTQQAIYLQDKLELGPFLLKLGLRNTRFSPENQWRPEPRASLALDLHVFTLKAAWGRYHQYVTAMNTQDAELSQFLDYYYPLRRMKPLVSIHHILGLEGKLTNRVEYSITAYYKDLTNLYRFDYFNTIASIYSYQAALEQGEGEAYGVECLLRGEMGRLSGWITYALSRSTRRYPSIQQGKTFLYDGDQTHNLKAVLLYQLTTDITASTTFQFTSGFPKTWETGISNRYNYNPVANTYGLFPEYLTPAKNNVRFPPRIEWEIGWQKKLRSGFGYRLAEFLGTDEAYLTTTVRNLLFLRRNPYIYFYLPGYGYYGYDLSYFPTVRVGYSIKF
ncbi:MAG: TonB-dependent receptor [Fidelibacterota bacterium]|nr:MAG: TonB-dependent receptor [Candidatus Neomarinimicrobiota bacterium]